MSISDASASVRTQRIVYDSKWKSKTQGPDPAVNL
jgi:hypothetical protein